VGFGYWKSTAADGGQLIRSLSCFHKVHFKRGHLKQVKLAIRLMRAKFGLKDIEAILQVTDF